MFAFLKRFGRSAKSFKRGFHDLLAQRLTSDWTTNDDDPNQRLLSYGKKLRQQARDMAETNPYAIAYLRAVPANVVGPKGIKFQSQIMTADGAPDEEARRMIEERWADWKLPQHCTTGGTVHHNDEDRMQERALAMDGEVFVWVRPGYDNAHKFAIQTLESDFVDIDFNESKIPNSPNHITMGKEITPDGRVVAYWVEAEHPGALHWARGRRTASRIPALSEYLSDRGGRNPSNVGYILHQFEAKRSGQQRGIPDLVAVMGALRKLGKTEDGHHDQAQLSAYAVWQKVTTNADEDDGSPVPGSATIRPGSVVDAGFGRKFEVMQPAAPNTALPAHGAYTLKGSSAGLGVSYAAISGDLSETSFSSMRFGADVERTNYEIKQDHTINSRDRPIFYAWLRTQLLFMLMPGYTWTDEDKLRAGRWQGRTWGFINPLQDVEAIGKAIEYKITSPQREIIKRGGDPDEIVRELAEWREMTGDTAATGAVDMGGEESGEAEGANDAESMTQEERAIQVALAVQKIYLGVGVVLTATEAREIVNAAGGNLSAITPEGLGAKAPMPFSGGDGGDRGLKLLDLNAHVASGDAENEIAAEG